MNTTGMAVLAGILIGLKWLLQFTGDDWRRVATISVSDEDER